MVTKPMRFQGTQLVLNYATSAAGSVRVEIQDEHGNPLPAYRLEDARLLFGDKIEESFGVKQLQGAVIRLRFVMKDADLYSIRFR